MVLVSHPQGSIISEEALQGFDCHCECSHTDPFYERVRGVPSQRVFRLVGVKKASNATVSMFRHAGSSLLDIFMLKRICDTSYMSA
eukprot:6377843-Amphidinium_carterae.1